jgi:predicted nucleic acid-binding protein
VTVAYFDTSAVMRYLLAWRTGHQTARQAWDEADDVTSVSIVYAETRAALAAARRARSLTAPGLRLAKTAWETLWDELAEREALRGYDAVHLAAALVAGCDLLLCADAALCAAGRRRGLPVVDLDHVP